MRLGVCVCACVCVSVCLCVCLCVCVCGNADRGLSCFEGWQVEFGQEQDPLELYQHPAVCVHAYVCVCVCMWVCVGGCVCMGVCVLADVKQLLPSSHWRIARCVEGYVQSVYFTTVSLLSASQ